MELDWGMIAALIIGPGSGVAVGVRTALNGLRVENTRQSQLLEEQSQLLEEQSGLLEEMNAHLARLNSRVTKSEQHIAGIEEREDENNG